MDQLETVAWAVVAMLVMDPLVAGRMKAINWKDGFEYRYWPLSKYRLLSFGISIIGVSASLFFSRPEAEHPPLWPLFLGFFALLSWMSFLYLDVRRQHFRYRETLPE